MRHLFDSFYYERAKTGKYAIYEKSTYDSKVAKPRTEAKYTKIWLSDGAIFASTGNYTVMLDKNDFTELIPDNEYVFISDLHNARRTCINKYKKYAVMINNVPVSPWYDNIRIDGLVNVVTMGENKFLTDAKGITKISEDYKRIGSFENVLALERAFAHVETHNGLVGIIDDLGYEEVPCEYVSLHKLRKEIRVFHKILPNGDHRYGIIAVNGEELTRDEYDEIKYEYGRVFLKSLDGEWHEYNTLGVRRK